jgi:hypothetical protein
MNTWKEVIQSIFAKDPYIKAVLTVPNPDVFSPLVDGFDHLVLVISENHTPRNAHYLTSLGLGVRLHVRILTSYDVETWIMVGQDRRIIEWLMNGEILLDPNHYLNELRGNLIEFPFWLREKKVLIEFNQFLIRYLQAKEHLHLGHVLDAHSSILVALHHWARLALVEQGLHPEVTLWSQMKKINPGIHKLYEEIVQGQESISQRIELVLLACEFHVMSKMEQCCSYLLQIVRSRSEGWTVQELNEVGELTELQLDLSLLLKKLVKKGLVQESIDQTPAADGYSLFLIRYH